MIPRVGIVALRRRALGGLQELVFRGNSVALQSAQVQPLDHRRILITRTRQQASELASQLEALGAEILLIPTIELAPPSSYAALDAALANLPSFDWMLFTSANAVHAFHQRAQLHQLRPTPRRIAAVGPATAKVIESIGLQVDLIPATFVAESLAEALLPHAAGRSFLLVRAEEARDVLPNALAAAGAQVTIAPAYRSLTPPDTIPALQRLFASGGALPADGVKSATGPPPGIITFTSSSTARNLIALLDAAGLQLPPGTVLASIGPITSATLRDLGYAPTLEAAEPTIAALVAAIVACEGLRPHGEPSPTI
jgi:uroporphyrinogen-III synthase